MEFIKKDKPKNNSTSSSSTNYSFGGGGGAVSVLNFLELGPQQLNIKNGFILKTTQSAGIFGDVTGQTAIYSISDGAGDEGFIWKNASGTTNNNIASLSNLGVFSVKKLKLIDNDKSVNISVNPTTNNLLIDKTLVSSGDVVAFSDGSGSGSGGSGSGGGGLIQTVYGLNALGSNFQNSNLNDTFNAFTINSLHNRLVGVENGSATNISMTGDGNAITSISKNGNTITVNKGLNLALNDHTHSQYAKQSTKQMFNGATFVTADVDYADYAANAGNANRATVDLNGNTIHTTYSPITHNHTLSGLTEKSYNSLTDKPTSLSQFTNNLGNYGGFLTSINSAQVTTALGYTPSNSNHNHTLAGLSEKSYNSLTDRPTSLSQFTNNLGNYGGFATTADLNNKIFLKSDSDNRDVNTIPNDYNSKLEIKGLKLNSTIGITNGGVFSVLLGVRGWQDSSGGDSHELAFGGNGSLFHRHGATTSWGGWRELYHTGNFTPSNYLPVGGTAQRAWKLPIDNTVVNGASGLQYAQNSGKSGVGITDNPTNDWYHHIIMNHPSSIGYYAQISSCFHNDGVYLRRMVNGSLTAQRKFILNDVEPKFNLMADGAGTTSTPKFIEINFNGWNGALSPKARIAATEQSTNLNKSDLIFYLNDGSSASNLTERMRIVGDSGTVNINNNLTVGGNGNFNSVDCNNIHTYGDVNLEGFLYSDGVNTRYLHSYGELHGNAIICNNLHSYDYISLGGKIRCGTATNTHQLNVGGNGAVIGNAFNYIPSENLVDLSVGSNAGSSRILVGQSNSFRGGLFWNYNATGANATLGLGINVSGVFKQSILLKNNGDVDINANLSATGNITATGEITAYSSSDERLKKDIEPITNGLDIIDKINPVTYNWNDKAIELNPTKSTNKSDVGVVAQELEEVLPNLVHPMYDGEYLGVDYIKLIPYLISSVKQLKNEITELKNEIIELKK